jgi:hypothetical protein
LKRNSYQDSNEKSAFRRSKALFEYIFTPNEKELEHHSSLNNLLIEFLQQIAFPQNAQFALLVTS